MRKLTFCFIAVLLLLLFAGRANAQGVPYHDIAFSSVTGKPIGGVNVYVCTASATGAPCSPQVNIYTNQALSPANLITQPLNADNLGNFSFWAAPGIYKVQVIGTGITTYSYSIIDPVDLTNSYSGTVNFTGIVNITTLNVSGVLTLGTLVLPNLGSIHFAAGYSGGDCGAKINSADADLGVVAGEIWVNQACGLVWTTRVSVSANHTVRMIQAGNYVLPTGTPSSPAITLAGNNSKLICGGWDTIFNYTTPASDSAPMVYANATAGNVVKDCSFIGTAGPTINVPLGNSVDTATNGQEGILFNNVTNCQIIHNQSTNHGYAGIVLVRSTRCEVNDNTANSNTSGGGILGWSTDLGPMLENTFDKNIISNNGCLGAACFQARGILMARLGTTNGPVGNKITGNTANSNSLYGIEVYQYGRKNIITGNTFNGNCVGGIHDWTNTFDIISFNIVTGTGGITCPNSAGGVINGGYGIRVGSGYYSQVVNNLVAGNNTSNLAGYPGIGVDGEGALNSFGMLVSDNTVRDHQASNDILVSSSALTTLGAATYYYVAVAYGTTGTVLAQSSEVSAVAGGGGSVLLSWSEYQGVAVYRVYRGTAPAGENVYYILPGPAYVDTGNVSTRNAGTPPGSGNSIANPSATVVAGGFDTQGIVVHDNALYGTTSVTPLSVGSNAWSYANPTSLTNPAASGNLRLNSGDSIVWRNNAGTGDIPLAKSAGDLPTFQGNIIPVIALGAQSNLRSATAALTFGSIPANSCSEQPIAVTGVPTTSAVFVSPQVSIGANFSWSAYVSASGTVQARVCNVTTGALTPSVQTWTATELQ